ncbi:MAG: hypothetical protein LBB80_02140 [Treponema sp.]|nr:hypothetical protein [Treponema sp.]
MKTPQVQVIRNRGVMYRGIQHDVFGFIHVFPSVAAIQEKTYLDTLLRAITAGWIRYQPCYIHGFVKGV